MHTYTHSSKILLFLYSLLMLCMSFRILNNGNYCDLHVLLSVQDEYNEKLSQTNGTIQTLEEALKMARINGDARIRALVEACIKSSEKLVTRATTENDVAVAAGTSAYFMMFGEELTELLNELSMVHSNYVADNYNNVVALAKKCILMGHLMATVYIQGNTICKTSANIERGESKKFRLTCLKGNVF